MITDSLQIKKSIVTEIKPKTPKILNKIQITRTAFLTQDNRGIRFPSVKLEGDIFKTSVSDISHKKKNISIPKSQIRKSNKTPKPLPIVDILNYFSTSTSAIKQPKKFRLKYKTDDSPSMGYKRPKKHPKSSHGFRTASYNKEFSLNSNKVISYLQPSREYVKKNNQSREKVVLKLTNYNPTPMHNISYYY